MLFISQPPLAPSEQVKYFKAYMTRPPTYTQTLPSLSFLVLRPSYDTILGCIPLLRPSPLLPLP
jgi:hypothetical protein